MGTQHQQKPAATSIQSPTVQAPAKPKVATTFDPANPTAYLGINTAHLGPCKDGPDGAGCILTHGEREALATEYFSRVNSAQTAYLVALTQLKLEETIKKTEELPWYLDVFLSVVSSALEKGLTAAAGAAASEITSLAQTGVDTIIKAGMSTAKQSLKSSMTQLTGSESQATRDKEHAKSYIDYLSTAAMTMFQEWREGPPAHANDVELLRLFDAFDGKNHTSVIYHATLAAAVRRYVESPVSQLGRRLAWDEKRDNRHVELETRVAWLITKGAGNRLIYVDRAFSSAYQVANMISPSVTRSTAYDAGSNQLSLQQDATWTVGHESRQEHETPIGPDLMLNYVEPEFEQLALERQKQIWLSPPETFMLDYSYAPPRMVKVAS